MGNAAEQSDDSFESGSEGQIGRLEGEETTEAEVLNVNRLRKTILTKISGAAEEGVISRTDVERLTANLRSTDKSEADVWRVENEVSQVISESKQLIEQFTGDEQGLRELAVFKELSLVEKRDYIGTLRKKAEGLMKRADKLTDLLPEEERRLATLHGAERAQYVEELTDRRANIAEYGWLLERSKRHFSADSMDAFLSQFKDLPVGKQAEWIKLFGETQVKPREKLLARYDALPSDYQKRAGKFFELSRHEKETAVQRLEEELKFDDAVDKSPQSKYLARAGREYAKESFRMAPASLRRDMTAMLEKHMKAEAELGEKFEKLPAEVQARYPGFIEMDFEKKDGILKNLDKHDGLRGEYESMIDRAVGEKLMNQRTRQNYLDWFTRSSLDDKKNAIALFAQEMLPRKNLKGRFESELPKDVQQSNAHFYALGGHERMELFERLKGEAEKKALAAKPENGESAKEAGVFSKEQLNQMAMKARELAGNGKRELAAAMYQTILIYDSANKDALAFLNVSVKQRTVSGGVDGSGGGVDVAAAGVSSGERSDRNGGPDDAKIRDSVRAVKQEGGVKRMLRLVNVAAGVAELAHASDLNSKGEFHSEQKDTHLESEEARALNKQLLEHSGGKMKLGRRSEDKARKIQRIDITRLDKLEDGDVTTLKNTVVGHEGDSRNRADHIQLVRQDSGQELAGKSGVHAAEKMTGNLRRKIVAKAEEGLRASGQELTEEARARIRRQVEEDDLRINLREAA
jgi:hypothetical protein